MFKPNSNYLPFDLPENRNHLEEGTSLVVVYPENLLPDISVPSEFGDCVVRSSDLYDLLNQDRIENLGAEGIRDYLLRYYPQSSQISDAISKLSDDEIMNSVKSRHIQSYSELMSWSKWLQTQIEQYLVRDDAHGVASDDAFLDNSAASAAAAAAAPNSDPKS